MTAVAKRQIQDPATQNCGSGARGSPRFFQSRSRVPTGERANPPSSFAARPSLGSAPLVSPRGRRPASGVWPLPWKPQRSEQQRLGLRLPRDMDSTASNVESEYIKNLQQQIYFLELEANFLREQAKKATNFQPRIASEMEHIRQKVQELQSQSDGLQLELKRKESGLQMLKLERERLSNQITVADETYSKEKQTLVEKIVELKRRKEQKDREVSVKEMEILQAKQELEQQQMCLSNRQQAIIELKGKVKQQVELQKEVKFQLSEKRREFLKVQSAVHEIENEIFRKTAAMQEHITHELRNEISILHQQVRERELLAEQDRLLRSKMVDDYATLTKENAMMQSRLLELNKQREIERVLKEESYTALSAGIMQFLAVKDHENHLKEEIQRYQELLEQEESTFRDLQDKISILEKGSTSHDLKIATMNSRITEIRAVLDKEELDNMELKRDKSLLIDLASDLQKQRFHWNELTSSSEASLYWKILICLNKI
uniref:Uncharacterized protein isoform X2 n=1 Tax=Pogona vitticeps TaxID=103695 RepID=A0ABM5G697_9SAUR